MTTPRRSRSSRLRLRWVVGAGAVLVAIAVAGAWFATRPAATTAPQYDVLTLARTTETDTVSMSGTINPQTQSNAAFRASGTITSIAVKVGDRVAKGAPLASIDPRDLDDAVALADANATAAQAQLTTVLNTSGATAAQVAAARAQVRSAEASLSSARNRRADATLVSPIAGTVAKVGYSVGDQVAGTGSSSAAATSGSSVLSGLGGVALTATSGGIVVISTDAWQLNASVGTADLPALKTGQPATITPTGTSTIVHGVVDTVGIVAGQNAGASATFPVTVKVTDAGARLYSGSSADAVVVTGTHPNVLTVPGAAVTTTNGASTVETVSGGTVGVRTVTLGRRFGADVEVVAGLSTGEQIRVLKAQVVKTSVPAYQAYVSPSATASR